MFEMKKIIGSLLMPLPVLLVTLFIALLFCVKQKKLPWSVSFISVLCLWLISTPWMASILVAPLEAQFPAFNATKHPVVQKIVVLGCDVRPNPALPANSQLGNCAITRLVEGVRLANLYPNAELFVSGAGIGKATNSALMTQTAMSLGIARNRIKQNPMALDTADEARFLAPHLVDFKVALVTSGSHMHRAKSLFNAQGIEVIPAPTDFANFESWHSSRMWIANADALRIVTAHVHEWVGLTWLSLVRLVDPEAM